MTQVLARHCRLAFLACFSIVSSLAISSAHANRIHVPSDQWCIRAAIAVAESGDTIVVAGGTYTGPSNGNLIISEKALTIMGAKGPNLPVIDCSLVMDIDFGGFTVYSSSDDLVTIERLIIRGARSSLPGSAVRCTGASLRLKSCTFEQDGATAVYAESCYAEINSCSFLNCSIANYGGAAYFSHCDSASINYSTFTNDAAYSRGGAIYSIWSPIAVRGCTFTGNRTSGSLGFGGRGGAISLTYSPSSIADCKFHGNWVDGGSGGAVYAEGSYSKIERSVFYADSITPYGLDWPAFVQGAAVCFRYADSCFVTNCTFVGNRAVPSEDTSSVLYGSNVSVDRCIFAFNSNVFPIGGTPQISCTDIFGNELGDWTSNIAEQATIPGNISVDPLFCDTVGGSFRISPFSPCAPANNACGLVYGAVAGLCGYIAGDANGDGVVDISDIVFLIAYFFDGEFAPIPMDAGDPNCDHSVDISDAVYLISYAFSGGPPPCLRK
jgi:hypothetical protein